MEKLKIRVFTEQQAKAAIELAKKLGYKEAFPKSFNLTDGYVCLGDDKDIFKVCIAHAGSELNEFKYISMADFSLMANHVPQHKEYLDPRNNYELIEWDGGFMIQDHWIAVPEGAEIYVVDNKVKEGRFYKKDDNQLSIFTRESWVKTQYRTDCFYEQMASCGLIISWQRHTQPEELPFIDDEPKHSHYFKDVSGLEKIDVYRVLELYGVTNPCLQHAIKKLLCSGERGAKDSIQDIQEAIDTLNRRIEMIEECK